MAEAYGLTARRCPVAAVGSLRAVMLVAGFVAAACLIPLFSRGVLESA